MKRQKSQDLLGMNKHSSGSNRSNPVRVSVNSKTGGRSRSETCAARASAGRGPRPGPQTASGARPGS